MSYDYITKYNSPNYTPASQSRAIWGYSREIKGFTYHWWGDPATMPTFEGVVSWLCRPGGGTSAHYVLEDGRVACIVAPQDGAWHSGNALGNATTIGIEMNPRRSEGDYRTAAEFSSQLIDAFGDQLKYRHSDWQATQCPGSYDINRIDRESYTHNSGAEWGDVTPKNKPVEPTPPPVVVPPVEPPKPEWIQNLKDYTAKLTVLQSEGTRIYDLNTNKPIPDNLIPRGTQVDIAKQTTISGTKYYISSWAATKGAANGIKASDLGIPVDTPVNEKPEWLENIEDIADKDMWTRSETPVLNLADGTTAKTLPINTQVFVTHSTTIVGNELLVLEGGATGIETVFLSDKPITSPAEDIAIENNTLLKQILEIVKKIWEAITRIFK